MSQALVNNTKSPKAPKDDSVEQSAAGRGGDSSQDHLGSGALSDENYDEQLARNLITRIQQGSQTAFAELIDRYHRQVAALAFKIVSNYDEAADVAQIVFVKMYNNIWRYDDTKKFYSWLYRITINAAIDYQRKHKRHRHEPLENFHEIIDGKKSNPEASYRRHQITDHVRQAADQLSDKQRLVFTLRDLQGCGIDEVASSMEISEATVRWYLHRARTRVRQELRRSCPQALKFLGVL